jgi:hypothetical protein
VRLLLRAAQLIIDVVILQFDRGRGRSLQGCATVSSFRNSALSQVDEGKVSIVHSGIGTRRAHLSLLLREAAAAQQLAATSALRITDVTAATGYAS